MYLIVRLKIAIVHRITNKFFSTQHFWHQTIWHILSQYLTFYILCMTLSLCIWVFYVNESYDVYHTIPTCQWLALYLETTNRWLVLISSQSPNQLLFSQHFLRFPVIKDYFYLHIGPPSVLSTANGKRLSTNRPTYP